MDGVQRRFVIGEYPDLELADARVAAAMLMRQVRKEEADPAGDAKWIIGAREVLINTSFSFKFYDRYRNGLV